MEYLLVSLISASVAYLLSKKANKKEIENLNLIFQENSKSNNEILIKNSELINIQSKILFYISDSFHNIGSNYFINNPNKQVEENEFFRKLRIFFTQSRILASTIPQGHYSESELVKILEYIQNDVCDFCNHKTKELDSEILWNLIRRN